MIVRLKITKGPILKDNLTEDQRNREISRKRKWAGSKEKFKMIRNIRNKIFLLTIEDDSPEKTIKLARYYAELKRLDA